METIENNVLLQRTDKNGNKIIDYPATKISNVIDDSYTGLDNILDVLEAKIETIMPSQLIQADTETEALILSAANPDNIYFVAVTE